MVNLNLMKTIHKNCSENKKTRNKRLKNDDGWKLSVKQVLKGACLINSDAGADEE